MFLQNGFVLPIVMMMLVVFSLLTLLIAEQNLLGVKLNQNQVEAQKFFYAAENAVATIKKELAQGRIVVPGNNTLIIDEITFDYAIQSLVFVSCAHLYKKKRKGVQFYRIILHADSLNYLSAIQADYALMSQQQGSCRKNESEIIIKPGLQSWHIRQ